MTRISACKRSDSFAEIQLSRPPQILRQRAIRQRFRQVQTADLFRAVEVGERDPIADLDGDAAGEHLGGIARVPEARDDEGRLAHVLVGRVGADGNHAPQPCADRGQQSIARVLDHDRVVGLDADAFERESSRIIRELAPPPARLYHISVGRFACLFTEQTNGELDELFTRLHAAVVAPTEASPDAIDVVEVDVVTVDDEIVEVDVTEIIVEAEPEPEAPTLRSRLARARGLLMADLGRPEAK